MKIAFIFKKRRRKRKERINILVVEFIDYFYDIIYDIIISTLISSRIYLPLLNFIVIHVSLIRRRNVTQGVPDF